HVYKVKPTSGGVQFYVDGALKTTIAANLPPTQPFSVVLSSYGASALQVQSVQVQSYALTGSYTSAIFDATRMAVFNTVSWLATLPAGTGITVAVRTGAAVASSSS